MLYQQSVDIIRRIRGKEQSRKWKVGLKNSFIRSHWILPYPDSRSFMRKSKGEVVWWPNYHTGVYEYYRSMHFSHIESRPLPAKNIKHHPVDLWRVGDEQSYMRWEIEPEQDIIQQSEHEIYNTLKDISTRFYECEGEFRLAEQTEVSSVVYTIPNIFGRKRPYFTRDRERKKKKEEEWDDSDWFLEVYERIQRYDEIYVEDKLLKGEHLGAEQKGIDFNKWSDISSDEEGVVNQMRKELPRLKYAVEKYCEKLKEKRKKIGVWQLGMTRLEKEISKLRKFGVVVPR